MKNKLIWLCVGLGFLVAAVAFAANRAVMVDSLTGQQKLPPLAQLEFTNANISDYSVVDCEGVAEHGTNVLEQLALDTNAAVIKALAYTDALKARTNEWGSTDPQPTQSVWNITWSPIFRNTGYLATVSSMTETGTVVFDVVRKYYTNTVRNYQTIVTGVVASIVITNISGVDANRPIDTNYMIGVLNTNQTGPGPTNWWYSLGVVMP